ncbi:MAG: prepilin-type N-terminal cleavage/methylation domain-containing protein [Dehalococcoidia bacterium]
MKRARNPRRVAGFTLLELLIAAAILGVVIMYLMQTFSTAQKTYVVVEQVSEAQQNLRVVADLIERDLRLAGYLVPAHAAVCGVDVTNGSDTLFVSNADVILPADQLQVANFSALLSGNLGARVTDPGAGVGGTIGGLGVNVNLAKRWIDVDGGPADFAVNQGVILVDRNDPNGRSACGVVTQYVDVGGNAARLRVDFLTNNLGPMAGNPDVRAIPAHVYSITPPNPGVGTPAQFYRDGLLLANDVEDLQIAYFFDLDDDRVLDAGEFQGDLGLAVGDGIAVPYDSSAVDGSTLRQVQISLVTSTREDDPNDAAPAMIQQVTGNRNPATIAAPDRKRRRVYSSTVRLRNV